MSHRVTKIDSQVSDVCFYMQIDCDIWKAFHWGVGGGIKGFALVISPIIDIFRTSAFKTHCLQLSRLLPSLL